MVGGVGAGRCGVVWAMRPAITSELAKMAEKRVWRLLWIFMIGNQPHPSYRPKNPFNHNNFRTSRPHHKLRHALRKGEERRIGRSADDGYLRSGEDDDAGLEAGAPMVGFPHESVCSIHELTPHLRDRVMPMRPVL